MTRELMIIDIGSAIRNGVAMVITYDPVNMDEPFKARLEYVPDKLWDHFDDWVSFVMKHGTRIRLLVAWIFIRSYGSLNQEYIIPLKKHMKEHDNLAGLNDFFDAKI